MSIDIAKSKTVYIWEDSGLTIMARILDASDGEAAQQADVSTITYVVTDITDPDSTSTTVTSTSLTVASVMFDTLQTDDRWTVDATGYNFLHTVASTAFSASRKTYRVEYLFTPASGQPYFVVVDVKTKTIYRS